MKKYFLIFSIFLSFLLLPLQANVTVLKPSKNGTKKWQIAYYEGGNYISYVDTLKATLNNLAKLGWMNRLNYPKLKVESDTKELWDWVSKNVRSPYLEFKKDAYYSAGWNYTTRHDNRSKLITRLNTTKEIDLVIAMGTWAGQDLATNEHATPTMNMSVSNPLDANIIKSPYDSGLDHVHSKIDPERYKRQVRIFHDIFGFQTLGIMYEDSRYGKIYAAIKDIQAVAKERKFKLIECKLEKTTDNQKVLQDALACHEELSTKVDALYKTVHSQLNFDTISQLMTPLHERNIPTFSQYGPEEVKYGVLMSISASDFDLQGNFHAHAIAKVLNGIKARKLNMILEDLPNISINLEVARKINYTPSVEVLSVADTIYSKVDSLP